MLASRAAIGWDRLMHSPDRTCGDSILTKVRPNMETLSPVTQLHFEAPPSDKPSLGDSGVVTRPVNEFAQGVIGIRNDFLAGKLGADNPMKRIEALAANAGDMIMGRNPDFHAMEWQNPIRLGSKIRYLCTEIRTYPDPGQAFFMFLAKQVTASMIAVEEQRLEPEQAATKLRPVLEDVVDRIVGAK